MFAQYYKARKPNADAIANMALDNFTEMMSKTADPRFLLGDPCSPSPSRAPSPPLSLSFSFLFLVLTLAALTHSFNSLDSLTQCTEKQIEIELQHRFPTHYASRYVLVTHSLVPYEVLSFHVLVIPPNPPPPIARQAE